MILYLLDHRHWIDTEYYDTKLIGIFSSEFSALKTIEKYSRLPGFCDFKDDFCVETFDIFLNKKKQKKGIIYLLTTTQMVDDDEITISYCLYANRFFAKIIHVIKSIVLHIKKQKLYMSKHYVDSAGWSEGFVTGKTGDGSR